MQSMRFDETAISNSRSSWSICSRFTCIVSRGDASRKSYVCERNRGQEMWSRNRGMIRLLTARPGLTAIEPGISGIDSRTRRVNYRSSAWVVRSSLVTLLSRSRKKSSRTFCAGLSRACARWTADAGACGRPVRMCVHACGCVYMWFQ